MTKGNLFVISGPSGVGKGTIVSRLIEERPKLIKSISATTRSPRDGEVNGSDYYFLTKDEFNDLIVNGGLLEWAQYSNNCYGTPVKFVMEQLESGNDVVLEIDVQGAFQVKESMPDSILIFIEPPSIEELEKRLRGRGTEDEGTIMGRMQAAKVELSRKMEYDKQFVNDNLDEAIQQVSCFMDSIVDQKGK